MNIELGARDYASSYFKYKTFISIREEHAYKSLKRLKLETQVNINLVETDLGAGNHGYIRLVLID